MQHLLNVACLTSQQISWYGNVPVTVIACVRRLTLGNGTKDNAFTAVHFYHKGIFCSPILFVQALTSTYNASHMCGSPATDFGYRNPGLIHRVTMDG